jgi:hypothetical protein
VANYYYPSMTTVYSLFSEPSLAFLWTHGCTFYVRPFPSGYLTTPTQPRAARETTTSPLWAFSRGLWPVLRFGVRVRGVALRAAVFLML